MRKSCTDRPSRVHYAVGAFLQVRGLVARFLKRWDGSVTLVFNTADGLSVETLDVAAPRRSAFEQSLQRDGHELSPFQRRVGDALVPRPSSRVVLAACEGSRCLGLLSLDIHPSRRLRGSRVIRVRRFSSTFTAPAIAALADGLIATAERVHARVVLLSTSGADPASVDRAAAALVRAGFAAHPNSLTPDRTLLVDLTGGEAAVLGRASKSLRRTLRELATAPLEFRRLTDPSLAPRVEALKRATLERRGVDPSSFPLHYERMIAASLEHPQALSLVGGFRTDVAGADALIAWELATFDGVRAVSEHAAMERVAWNGRTLSAGYGTLWASIRWAMGSGARAFDLGGVTVEGDPDHEQFKSVSAFKANFGGELVSGLDREFQFAPQTSPARFQRLAARCFETLGAPRS